VKLAYTLLARRLCVEYRAGLRFGGCEEMMRSRKETAQLAEWQGDFGKEYTERNLFTPEQVDDLWVKNYGITRSELNRRFLGELPAGAKILEVGCNIANQLLLLQRQGYGDLHGVEVQSHAIGVARSRASQIKLVQGTAFRLPYKDGCFDLVFTSGVLIHIAPADLPVALDEIHRCARTYILGAEYYAPAVTEVSYRERSALLWKMDYARQYLSRFDDLTLVREQQLPYLGNTNVDSMFLLRKNG
jgi:pseudaminic acid biosynthesis-associated methylase